MPKPEYLFVTNMMEQRQQQAIEAVAACLSGRYVGYKMDANGDIALISAEDFYARPSQEAQ